MTAPTGAAAAQKPVVEKVQVGVTDYSDILARYGSPARNQLHADGSRTVTYAWTKTRIRPVTFVPLLNLVGGGGKTRINAQTLTFGPDGKLVSLTADDAKVECVIWSGCSGASPD
ncbi:hypothetical protein [Phenylobacterium immobile]|uniref:hypothetical protein n=1 Tax=Phenylobacterium immobile TaxID=21 RepID=UPI000B852345|nr:hypothetical protein [Phenylobacterium immobile]